MTNRMYIDPHQRHFINLILVKHNGLPPQFVIVNSIDATHAVPYHMYHAIFKIINDAVKRSRKNNQTKVIHQNHISNQGYTSESYIKPRLYIRIIYQTEVTNTIQISVPDKAVIRVPTWKVTTVVLYMAKAPFRRTRTTQSTSQTPQILSRHSRVVQLFIS